MKCPKCNRQIYDDCLFCPYCGEKINLKNKCPNCNKTIPEESVFCPYCGKKIESSQTLPKNGDNTDSDSWDEKSSMYISLKLLEFGREFGAIKSKEFVHIPELLLQNKIICTQIFQGITQLAEIQPKVADPIVSLKWCCYAGMGVAFLWNENWNLLKEKGIYESLIEKCGLYKMDEYVSNMIGIGYKTEAHKKLDNLLWYIGILSLGDSETKSNDSDNKLNGFSFVKFLESLTAMYNFGMVYELNRLGFN